MRPPYRELDDARAVYQEWSQDWMVYDPRHFKPTGRNNSTNPIVRNGRSG
ncbi:hypothetical protein N9L68_09205 [bacterium]|nr:hypothetical protein [bacterium]